jgi:hypothetical protein
MTAYISTAETLRQAFHCAVIIIHHCGIDDKRPRGHTSLTGAVDGQIKVTKQADGAITTIVEFEEGPSSDPSRLRA